MRRRQRNRRIDCRNVKILVATHQHQCSCNAKYILFCIHNFHHCFSRLETEIDIQIVGRTHQVEVLRIEAVVLDRRATLVLTQTHLLVTTRADRAVVQQVVHLQAHAQVILAIDDVPILANVGIEHKGIVETPR